MCYLNEPASRSERMTNLFRGVEDIGEPTDTEEAEDQGRRPKEPLGHPAQDPGSNYRGRASRAACRQIRARMTALRPSRSFAGVVSPSGTSDSPIIPRNFRA